MIDKSAILNDLITKGFSQGEIARRHGCSRKTVSRLAKEYGIGIGQGFRHYWEFSESSESLAYVIGAYITDGTLNRDFRSGKVKGVGFVNSDKNFAQKIYNSLEQSNLHPRWRKTSYKHKNHLGDKPLFRLATNVSLFGQWLEVECVKKSKLPTFLHAAPLAHQIAFLAGAIDGDGHVSSIGCIRINGVDDWLVELPTLLTRMGIRTPGCKVETVLQSGKPLYRVSINRADYRTLGGWCAIDYKQERMLFGKDNRHRR